MKFYRKPDFKPFNERKCAELEMTLQQYLVAQKAFAVFGQQPGPDTFLEALRSDLAYGKMLHKIMLCYQLPLITQN